MFSYLSPNTDQNPVVTDIRHLLKANSPHSTPDPNSESAINQRIHDQSHYYQYHQHLQYQPQYHGKAGSWSSSPEHPLVQQNNQPQQQQPQQQPSKSVFSFNFLNKSKENAIQNADKEQKNKKEKAAQKQNNKDKKEKKDKKKTPPSNGEKDQKLIESYLNGQQQKNEQKMTLSLQQQYFQNQQKNAQNQHQVASRRILEQHSYQNITEEAKNHAKKERSPANQQQIFRKFGDTNELMRNQNNNKKSVCNVENGVYRYSPHITSFAELEFVNRNSVDESKPHFNISKYLNIDIKSPSNSSAYSSSSSPNQQKTYNLVNNKKFSNNSSPNLNHNHHNSRSSSSPSSSLLSDKSSCSSLDNLMMNKFVVNQKQDYGSYLGPFNFRQLLRPTQGPTESLRKRKGVNSNSPPPPQRGKSFI